MKKLVIVMIAVMVVMLPRLVDAQEPTDNGTVPPYVVWLPVVYRPSIEEMYPDCPYETTLVSPEDGAIGGNIHRAVFTWRTEPLESEIWIHSCWGHEDNCTKELIESPHLQQITSEKMLVIFKFNTPGVWRVRAVCREGDNIAYGPFTDTWFFRAREDQ